EKKEFEKVREGFEAGARRIEDEDEELREMRSQVARLREELAECQLKERELAM
ncbi:MAG: hypothetical protein GWN87_15785, partial [Desulfuromonadales bacterium]|nr:hypothetical protein [Desulfuromonadales bacterium]NIS41721.1 hypothetical protein [Desulfuromonadales bacterium]